MDFYNNIVLILKTKGIEFIEGMSSQEINEIEALYDINFPNDLKQFYAKGIPISDGFYNWRNKSDENIKLINKMLSNPIRDLTSDVIDDCFWCDEWGSRPDNLYEAEKDLLDHYNDAPKLIPIYFHRYIPSVENNVSPPIFSVRGSDVIYYGENLISYLEIEFGMKKFNELNQNNCCYIPFWSDLI